MKRIVIIIFIYIVSVCGNLYSEYPKVANYFLDIDITESILDSLAMYDIVVLDMEVQNNSSIITSLREQNPNIKILAYMTIEEIEIDAATAVNTLRYELYNGIADEWWLCNANGEHEIFWEGTWMLNLTNQCPEINGKKWNDYFTNFICDNVLSTGLWDGFYLDNCWGDISWLDSDNIDINNDGIADDNDIVDREWKKGVKTILNIFRTRYPGMIFMGNGGYDFVEYLNGVLIETFPVWGGWRKLMDIYWNFTQNAVSPHYTILNVNTENSGDGTNYKQMRFGLTSTLLGDGYYSYDYGANDHSQTWWYDEFNVELGLPVSDAICIDSSLILTEDFENNLISFNIDENIASISSSALSGDYSLLANSDNSPYEWNEFLSTTNLSLPAKGNIRIKFKYKILDCHENTDFYIIARTINGGEDYDIGGMLDTAYTINDIKLFDDSFTLADFSDYQLIWGIKNKGKIMLDDIFIYDDRNLIYHREFEHGLVICNPSSQANTVILPHLYKKIDGTQDPVHNNGEVVSSVSIDDHDGIILLNVVDIDANNQKDSIHFSANIDYANKNVMFEISSFNKGKFEIKIFNVRGELIHILYGNKTDDKQVKVWNALDKNGYHIASGIYFAKLVINGYGRKVKFLYLK